MKNNVAICRMKAFRIRMLRFFLCFISIIPVFGRSYIYAQGNSVFRVKGFVDTYHALRVKSPNDFMSSRTRFRGEVDGRMAGASFFVSFNASYNALLKERTGFCLREAYWDYRASNWGLRAGRQLVIWGAADGVRITDLVSPMDMTEFLAQDYDDIRMPVNGIRFFLYNDKIKFEIVVLPVFEGFVLPVETGNPWNILPANTLLPVVWKEGKENSGFRLANTEYGGRLSFTLPGMDFALAALHTWNKMPVIKYKPSVSEIEASPHYYRMGFLGGDFSKPAGQFVFRGEAAFNMSKHFGYVRESEESQKGFNTLNYLAGIDWYAPGDWMLTAQFSSERIFGYESFIAVPEHTYLLTFNISKSLFNNVFKLSNFTYFDFNNKGWFSRITADYALSDQIHLMGGYDWFGGDKGVFGVYKNNSEIWIKANYSF